MEGRGGVAGFNARTVGGVLVLSTDLARRCRDGACRVSKRGRALAAVVFRVKWGGGSSVNKNGNSGIQGNDENAIRLLSE